MALPARLSLAFLCTILGSCWNGLPAGVGSHCSEDADCGRRFCVGLRCVEPCVPGAGDCERGECIGWERDDSRSYCMDCRSASELPGGWYCDGLELVQCESGRWGQPCGQCGCPSGERCDAASDSCGPLLAVGEPCEALADCASGNCGRDADGSLVCFVAAGEPCDATHCGACVTHDEGNCECLQACTSSLTCGDDEACEEHGASGGRYCLRRCASSRPCPAGYRCSAGTERLCHPRAVDTGAAGGACEDGGVPDPDGGCPAS